MHKDFNWIALFLHHLFSLSVDFFFFFFCFTFAFHDVYFHMSFIQIKPNEFSSFFFVCHTVLHLIKSHCVFRFRFFFSTVATLFLFDVGFSPVRFLLLFSAKFNFHCEYSGCASLMYTNATGKVNPIWNGKEK